MSDLIDRQAAISAICNACGKIDCDKMDKCEKLQLPPANSSEFPNNSDTISRQAAIDEIEYELEMINSALDSITLDFNARERLRQRRGEAREILNSIQQLPSAQPERKTGQWIFEERKRLVDETDDGAVYRIEKWWSCSECGYAKGYQTSRPSSNYCEDCGAKMLKEGENIDS